MEATTRNPLSASSIALNRPIPLDVPVITAIFSDMRFHGSRKLYHGRALPGEVAMGFLMNMRHRENRYFEPSAGTFALFATMVLAGVVVVFLGWLMTQ